MNLTIHYILKVLDAHISDEMNVPPLAGTPISPQCLPLAVQYSTEQNIVYSTSVLCSFRKKAIVFVSSSSLSFVVCDHVVSA
jgi:hypothetical protein